MKNILAARLSRNFVLLGLCVLGIIAAAIWSASVGRMDNYSKPSDHKTALTNYRGQTPAPLAINTFNNGLGDNAQAGSNPGLSGSVIPASSNAQVIQGSTVPDSSNNPPLNPPVSDPTAPSDPDIIYPVDFPACKPDLAGKSYCFFCESSDLISTSCGCVRVPDSVMCAMP